MRLILFTISILFALNLNAQKTTQLIEKGNESYKQKKYAQAKSEYTKALQKDKTNSVAQFNSGNASQKMNKYDEASKSYEAAASTTKDPLVKAQSLYNQGVSYIRQNKLQEAINSFKSSLRLNPNDDETRENLQKALNELRKQQQKNNSKQDQKKKQDPKDNQPKNKLSKEEAEKRLKELENEEKKLQKQMQKKNQSSRQLKDW